MDDGEDPRDAARDYLKANDSVLDEWLDGVTTRDGEPGAEAVRAAIQ